MTTHRRPAWLFAGPLMLIVAAIVIAPCLALLLQSLLPPPGTAGPR